MTASGESVRRLTDFGFSPSWSPDGAEIVVARGGFVTPTAYLATTHGLSIVTVKSGQARLLPIDGRAMQPAWSPAGARIAYWGVRGQSGQRDIWTVAADGSDAVGGGVPVTQDSAVDWSPTWSPDGQYLYFSSTRGGTMNLWRTRIDERSGRVAGEPEPITTPSRWSGALSFSRDGTRLAFASLDYRSTILRVPFDLAREAVVGPPEPLVRGTRPIRDHELSPDGEWLAFTEAGVQEDLFVARVDGTQYRRLTDDAFRDRGPAWAPDGARLAFYSDRAGAYEAWMIRPDGSGLVQLTSGTGTAGFPAWSPDGKRFAFGFDKWHLVDPSAPPKTTPPAESAISPTERFLPASWSSTGGRIAGQVIGTEGWVNSLGVYSVLTKQFTRVPGEFARAPGWLYPMWLDDSRRLLVRRPEGIALVNAETGAGRLLLVVGGDMIGHTVGVSRDQKWITYTETATEGDIWIATIKDPSSLIANR
jgi:Tol biopolymer transport system component